MANLQRLVRSYHEPDLARTGGRLGNALPPWWSAYMRATLAPKAMGRRSVYGREFMQFPAPMGHMRFQVLLVWFSLAESLAGRFTGSPVLRV